ncbi:MAG: Signal transduction histidine kinase, partial [Phycisphaerales bacterium]|nr:Signal transduction histidine kinase [Phycisphaerales bacterium]
TKKAEQLPEAAAEEGVATAAATVLVVDDDVTVRDVVTRALTDDGIRVITAADGEEGLRLARQRRPQLIFLDVMMPKMDGWAVLTSLKADPDLADIPVVMLTIMNETEMGYMLGAAEYLSKPIDRDRLANVMAKHRNAIGASQVLIVEDDPTTRDVLSRSLVKQGWDVAEAGNGRQALERVSQQLPALILLDLMMPEMNGFEFITELREHEQWQHVPVVVLTSKDLTNEERALLTGKVERIVQKGAYSRESLLREVRKIAATIVTPGAAISAHDVHTIGGSASLTEQ